jgi:pimeloyl-ACP methyl ester carboxylesterase
MPYAQSQGVRIHYQLEGAGPALLLQHGFTDSLESWYELGYVDALKHHYRLILVDARGHGASDKPHEPHAYEHKLHVADLIVVLDDLTMPKAHFLGYSMGGRIGFALATYAPERCSSLIIGGAHPYQPTSEHFDARLQTLKRGLEGMVATSTAAASPTRKARLLENDVEALMASWIGRMKGTSFEEVLPTMTMPCLLYAGEADAAYSEVKECIKYMPNVTFVSFPGLNHPQAFMQSHVVLPHIMQFLATVPA